MGKTKDRHVRQERDRGQGWDRKLFAGNPFNLNHYELKEQLKLRGLSTIGTTRSLRGRFVRALCVGIPVGGRGLPTATAEDRSGKTVWFEDPQIEGVCLSVVTKGKLIDYTDLDKPRWTTLIAACPVPPDTILEWSFGIEKAYNFVIGVARDPVDPSLPVGADEDGWGYFCTMGTKHHNDESYTPLTGEPYGPQMVSGDKITVVMNTKRGTLQFKHNGKPLGVAFRDIYGDVFPAISLCGICVVHGLGSKEILKEEDDDGVLGSIRIEGETTIPKGGQGKCQLLLDTTAIGGDLLLSPVAMGITFTPKPILVPQGSSASEEFTVTVTAGQPGAPVSLRVIVKKGNGNGNEIMPTYALDDAITVEPFPTAEEPPEKRQKT